MDQTPINTDEVAPTIKHTKMQVFADAYVSGNSAAKAAIAAGYSEKTAGVQGYKMLRRPDIAEYVRWHRAKRTEQTGDLQTQITEELRAMAFFNVQDVSRVDSDGNLEIDFTEADRDHYKAVTKIKTKTRSIYDNRGNRVATEKHAEIGLADKYRGLELLGKHLGMFKEAEQRVVVDVADRLLGARMRLAQAKRSEILDGSGSVDGE